MDDIHMETDDNFIHKADDSEPKLLVYNNDTFLEWYTSTGSEMVLLIAQYCTGKLHKSSVSPVLYRKLFGQSSQNNVTVYITVADSGEVYLANLDDFSVKFFCILNHHIIWLDIIEVSGSQFITTCSSNGIIQCGKINNDCLEWITYNLEIFPIVVKRIENSVIVSNGDSCYLFKVEEKLNESFSIYSKKLPFWGVVSVDYVNKKICMITCDNRKYTRSLNDLMLAGNPVQIIDRMSLSAAIETLKCNSDIIESKSKYLAKLNKYIEQINIAKIILDNAHDLFNIDFSLLPSLEVEGSFVMDIKLSPNRVFKIDFTYWKIILSIAQGSVVDNVATKCEALNFTNSFRIPFRLNVSDIKQLLFSDKSVDLVITLCLLHFYSEKIIVSAKVFKESYDILRFLTPSNLSYPNPLEIYNIYSPESEPDIEKETKRYKKVFITEEERLLKSGIFKNVNNANLWLFDVAVNFKFLKYEKQLNVEIESIDEKTLIYVKHALIDKILSSNHELKPCKETLKEAYLRKRLLEVEGESSPELLSLKEVYEMVSNICDKITV